MSNVMPLLHTDRPTMQIKQVARVGSWLLASTFTMSSALAQGLVAYYQIGVDKVPWVSWDTYVVDSESLVRDGVFIRYRSFRITAIGSDSSQEIRADCKTFQRSQVTDTSLYSTYDGTLSGQEVKAACKLAEKKGLLRN